MPETLQFECCILEMFKLCSARKCVHKQTVNATCRQYCERRWSKFLRFVWISELPANNITNHGVRGWFLNRQNCFNHLFRLASRERERCLRMSSIKQWAHKEHLSLNWIQLINFRSFLKINEDIIEDIISMTHQEVSWCLVLIFVSILSESEIYFKKENRAEELLRKWVKRPSLYLGPHNEWNRPAYTWGLTMSETAQFTPGASQWVYINPHWTTVIFHSRTSFHRT